MGRTFRCYYSIKISSLRTCYSQLLSFPFTSQPFSPSNDLGPIYCKPSSFHPFMYFLFLDMSVRPYARSINDQYSLQPYTHHLSLNFTESIYNPVIQRLMPHMREYMMLLRLIYLMFGATKSLFRKD